MSWLLFLYLLVFPFGQLGRIELAPTVAVHIADILAFFLASFWLLRWLGRKKKTLTQPLARPLLSFSAIAFFSLLASLYRFNLQEVFVGSLYLLRWITYVLFYFAIRDAVKEKQISPAKITNSLLVVGGFIAIFGLIQYLLFPDTRALFELGWDEHYFRLIGTFLDPGFTGILLVFFTILVFARRWDLFILGFSALALTYSRASYLAFLAGLTAWYIVRRNLRIYLAVLSLFILTVIFLPRPGGEGVRLERTSTISTRVENYQEAIGVGRENPLIGVGFNLFRYTKELTPSHSGAGADSSLLLVFATTGVAGLIAFLWLLWRLVSLSWLSRTSQQGLVLFSSVFALIVHSFFNNSLFYPWVLGWLFLLLGTVGRVKKSN